MTSNQRVKTKEDLGLNFDYVAPQTANEAQYIPAPIDRETRQDDSSAIDFSSKIFGGSKNNSL